MKILLSIILILPILFLNVISVQAADYQEGSVVFTESFDNLSQWTPEIGQWEIGPSGMLEAWDFNSNSPGRITGGGDWADFRLEFDTSNFAGVDQGVQFRRKDGFNTYALNFRFGNGEYGTPGINLVKAQDSVQTMLFSTQDFSLNKIQVYHVKVEAVGNHLQMWLDSTKVFDIHDSNPLSSGKLAIDYWTGDFGKIVAKFDNIKVTLLERPKPPVIFIPGIGGSELQADQDIFWSNDNGHGGTYSHAYPSGEKIWINQDEAIKLGGDDYFDVLRMKNDGQTPEAPGVIVSGKLTPFGYSDIDSFFSDLGYQKGVNYFIYAYDWRKDIKTTESELDNLITHATESTGQTKVNLVAHSMGGLVARNYISDPSKAPKVNKLIELGTPHLGAPTALKNLVYGDTLKYSFYFISIPVIPSTEVRELLSSFLAAFELVPSKHYYDFYNNSDPQFPYPFFDERDIDKNGEVGPLDFNHLKTLLSNFGLNMIIFNLAEQFHDHLDPLLKEANGVRLYEIVGSGQPTLGQIKEKYLINWPIKLIPTKDETFVNGDGTVPMYSASLKNESQDLSADAKIYYVEQDHSDLPNKAGDAMQIVGSILTDSDSFPAKASQKSDLVGEQLSVDQDANLDLYDENNNHTGINSDGKIETNIPNTYFDSLDNTKHAFVKKSAKKVTTKVTSPKPKTNITVRSYDTNQIIKVATYNNIPTTNTKVTTNPATLTTTVTVNDQPASPTTTVSGPDVLDTNPPGTNYQIDGDKKEDGTYNAPVSITLNPTDTKSGVLKTEYSLDGGQTIQTYSDPIILTNPGTNIVQFFSTDKANNQEIPQTISITIATPTQITVESTPDPTPSPEPTTIPEATSTPIPTPTPTLLASATTAPNPTPLASGPTPQPTTTPSPTAKPTPTPTPTPSPKLAILPIIATPSATPISLDIPNHPRVLGASAINKDLIKSVKTDYQKLADILVFPIVLAEILAVILFATFIKKPHH